MSPRKVIGKIGAILLSAFMVMMNINLTIFARTAHITIGGHTGYSYDVVGPDGHSEWNANNSYIYIDGELGFCIQPGHVLVPGDASQVSYSKLDELGRIAYVGYWDTKQTKADYMATQLYIWEHMGGTIRSTSLSDYPSRRSNIKKKLDRLDTNVSFNEGKYEMNVGETLRITDTNGVLSDYIIMNKGKADVSIDGNDLVIKANENTDDIANIFLQKVPQKFVGTPLAFSNGSQDVALLPIVDPRPAKITVTVNKYGSLKITKQDEDGTNVPITSFKLSKNSDMSSPIGTYTTGADGTVTVNDLLPATYYVQEVSVPNHLVLDSTIRSIKIQPNQTTEYNAKNNWVKGKIKLRKLDPESGKQVPGATYAIYNQQGQELERLVTTATGFVESGYLRFGDYTVKEVIAPDGYVLNDTVYPVTVSSNEQRIEVTGHDVRQRGRIEMTKEDSVIGGTAQGEATLEGAVYELKARENIMDPSKDGTIIHPKDSVVATLTTDKEGKASIDDLYLGKYYLKEKTPSNGYTLDPTEYDIDVAYAGQTVEVTTKQQTVKERVISQAFSIIKISDNGNGEADNLEGVEFTVKAQKDIDKYGSWEKAPVAKNAKGEDAAVLVTDKKGYAVSDELPFGTYVVRETKTPSDHYTVPDFTVTITEDSRDPQAWRVFNDEKFRAIVAIVKQDEDTGKTIAIPGATFKIKDLQTNKYVGYWEWNPLPHYVDTWETTEDGTVMTGDVLDPGEYQLEEIKAPNGYVINTEPVKFTVTNDGAYQIGPDGKTPVITVTMSDKAVKGRIKVGKEGEVLTGVTTDSNGNIQFKYENRKLPGAVFEIYAAENIMSADNQGDILYDKDELVETVVTGTNGEISSSLLPLGKYYIVEKNAPNGFTHSTEKKYVELKYEDQDTEVVFSELQTFKNERQKIEVEAVKKDKETNLPLAGAEFALYAKEDILSYDGEILVRTGEKIETSTSGEDGKAVFKADLPLFEYEVRETKAPDGYASTEQKYELDGKYKGQDTAVQAYSYEFFNEITKWDFTKKDITTDVEIPGAKMVVTEKDTGKVIEEWTSTRKPHRIKGLLVGKTYILHEELAPNGYLQAADIEFTVLDTGKVQGVVMKDELVNGTITVKKVGEVLEDAIKDKSTDGNYHFQYKERALPGMVFEVRAAEDIKHPDGISEDFYKKGELVATLTTGKDGTATTEKLPLGKYDVTEVKAPEGYIVNGETKHLELKYKDQNTSLVFDSATISNARQTVDIELIKKDKDTGEALSGAVFGLSSTTDIRSYDGKLLVKKGELIETVVSDENGRVDFTADLPLSVYEIRELKAPVGYASNDEVITVDAGYKGQNIPVIEYRKDVLNEITKIEVSKKDITNNEEIEGAHLKVYPKGKPGEVFETWVSGQDGKFEDGKIKPHFVKGLEPGNYTLEETSSPYGYAITQKVDFTVKDTGEVQGVEMKDEMVFGQLKWNKSGEIFMTTDLGQTEFGTVHSPIWEKSNLLGAEITIYAAQDITIGNHTYYKADEKVQTLESDWDAVFSKKLPVGRYYYKETKVPHGYIADTEKHYFEVKDNQINEIQTITSTLKNERPTVDIDMIKVLEEQETFKNPDAYKDIVFGIFAREDIYNYKGDVAIPYDTLVYTSGIDKDGHLTLADTFDLPNGVYYIRELSTNGQYVLNDNEYDFEIAYHGEDVSNYVVQIGEDGKINNELARGTIQVQKVDTNDADKKLEGIKFNISANEDMSNVIKTAETDAEGIASFSDLELGTYYLQEDGQVDGYVLNDHIYKVEVTADGDLLTITCENTPTEMEFSKVGETGSEELEGAELQVIDKETGNVVDEWVSGKEPHVIKYLVEGKEYIMKEVSAPYGYEIAEEIMFTAGDGQKVTMKDKMIRVAVEVNKVDSVTKENIKSKDFEFTMYSDEECKNPIAVVKGDTETGVARFDDVTYGTYFIKETKSPKGYKLSDEVKKVVIDENTPIVDGVYSFEYVNVLLPVIKVETGAESIAMLMLGLLAVSGITAVFALRRKKSK